MYMTYMYILFILYTFNLYTKLQATNVTILQMKTTEIKMRVINKLLTTQNISKP